MIDLLVLGIGTLCDSRRGARGQVDLLMTAFEDVDDFRAHVCCRLAGEEVFRGKRGWFGQGCFVADCDNRGAAKPWRGV